jgi:hypothetical protein
VRNSRPVVGSHNLTVWSQLAESKRLPSGENATDTTAMLCPWKVRKSRPVAKSHSLSVLSPPPKKLPAPDNAWLPSGENATALTESVCPSRVRNR